MAEVFMKRAARCLVGSVLAASVSACDAGPQFVVRYAPEFDQGRHTVAIFGVFQGGRMSAEAWYPLSARVSAAFGKSGACPTAFGDALKKADAELYAKLDEDVAANGVAEEILESIAPKTDADVIITLSAHGRVRQAKAPVIGDDPTAQGRRPDPTMPGRRPGAAGGGQHRRTRANAVTWNGLELSASLYSVKLKRSVGRISLLYEGTSVDEAVTLFANRLREELGGSTCRDWAWTGR
jgi:hypothetical protein